MRQRKWTLFGAVLAGAMLATSAAADENRAPTSPRDRAAAAPGSTEYERPDARQHGSYSAFPRGDNPNLPNPVTPSAANESAPQPQTARSDPTNSSGMEAVGATR